METRLERVKYDIETISSFNATPGQGYTRFSYSAEDRLAREYLMEQFHQLGLEIRVDGVGNIRARWQKKDLGTPSIMIGSHLDTVLHGGKFDGVLGVVAALEVVRVLSERQVELENPVEIIVFAEEEGSNFGSTCAGSKALTGRYSIKDLQRIKNPEGLSMYEVAKEFGLQPGRINQEVLQPNEVKAMLELHIEQGGVLDKLKIPIGIVEAIAGSKWLRVEIEGTPNHAGATPMRMRRDPMMAAAQVIAEIDKIVRDKAFATTVGTVGKFDCQPNIPNCIPEKVTFIVDLRDVNPLGIEIVEREIKTRIKEITAAHEVQASIDVMGESDAIKLSKGIAGVIENIAREKGIKFINMNSGAVHDSCLLAGVTEVGMIFVPSIDGRSHVPEEATSYEDVKVGCDLLLATTLKLARE